MVIPRTGTVDVEPAVAAASRRLLVIPHVYAEDVLVRSIEFARRLRPFFGDVYCLKWQDPVHVDECGFFARRWKQLHCSLDSLLRIGTATSKGTDGIVYVRARLLEPLLLRRLIGMPKAMALSRAFNGRVLGRLIKTLGVTHLLLASDRFGIPSRQGVRIIYDVVEWIS